MTETPQEAYDRGDASPGSRRTDRGILTAMKVLIALLYLAAVVLLVVAGFRPPVRYGLTCWAGACALLAFAIPALQAGFDG